MAGGQERILRGRIRSVQATKKITRAMELIAASRIVKAQQRVAAAVPYSDLITEVVRDLSAAGAGSSSPLLAGRDTVKTVCYVVRLVGLEPAVPQLRELFLAAARDPRRLATAAEEDASSVFIRWMRSVEQRHEVSWKRDPRGSEGD